DLMGSAVGGGGSSDLLARCDVVVASRDESIAPRDGRGYPRSDARVVRGPATARKILVPNLVGSRQATVVTMIGALEDGQEIGSEKTRYADAEIVAALRTSGVPGGLKGTHRQKDQHEGRVPARVRSRDARGRGTIRENAADDGRRRVGVPCEFAR